MKTQYKQGFAMRSLVAIIVLLAMGSGVYYYSKKSQPPQVNNSLNSIETTTTEEKVVFTISGGFDGGTCILIKTSRKSFLPPDAKQYLCQADIATYHYQFNRYLYPSGGMYERQIPSGGVFKKNINPFYFVDENFVDPKEFEIHSIKDNEWLDIGCYTPSAENKLCNVPRKIYLDGTSTMEIVQTEATI